MIVRCLSHLSKKYLILVLWFRAITLCTRPAKFSCLFLLFSSSHFLRWHSCISQGKLDISLIFIINAECFWFLSFFLSFFFSPGSWGISIPHAGLACSDGEPGYLESSRHGSCPICFWCATGRNFFLCFLTAYFYIYFCSSPGCLWHVIFWRMRVKWCGLGKRDNQQKKPKTNLKKTPNFGCLHCPRQLHSLSSWARYFWSSKSGASAWAVL